jgi:dTDP-4-dehydrorhamnose reductase
LDRILVLGGSGMLGKALVRELGVRGSVHVAPGRADLDLGRDDLEAEVVRRRPAAVLNAAAYTDVARAEDAGESAAVYRLNRDVPRALARACRQLGIPLVHVSTDYVFDGRKRTPYREGDAPGPLQVYGRSKLAGERAVSAEHEGALVARTSTLYGAGRTLRPHYVDAVLAQARKGGRIEVTRGPVSSPTFSDDLARGLLALLEAGARGLVHVTNAGGCSRLELARAVVEIAGLASGCEIAERAPLPAPPARPAYSVLDHARFAELAGAPPRPWREALADYLAAASLTDTRAR